MQPALKDKSCPWTTTHTHGIPPQKEQQQQNLVASTLQFGKLHAGADAQPAP